MSNSLKLNEKEALCINASNKKLIDLKCRLANLVIQQLQVSQNVMTAEKEMMDTISIIANSYNIKPEDWHEWNFDIKTMTFTRM